MKTLESCQSHRGWFKSWNSQKRRKTLKAAAQYWHAAKELERAKPYYLQAATKSKEGELFIFLGQVHFSLDEFDKAEKAIEDGLAKGKLKDEAAAYMLLGQINFENQKWNLLLNLSENALM